MITGIGVQTLNVIEDNNPSKGFRLLHDAGFNCCDFSLNAYLPNIILYDGLQNDFFDKTESEMIDFFKSHKDAAQNNGVSINQMHMPYPNYIPGADERLNDYLKEVVAVKSMKLCSFLECPYIVIHGFKLAYYLGSEEAEWEKTLEFISFLAPLAKELGVTICIENLYSCVGNKIMEGPCCDVRKVVERIDKLNSKYGAEILGFCFDTGHANLVGIDFEDFIVTLGKRLKVLHIHDNDGIGDLHQIPFTFSRGRQNESSTDWSGFIRGLQQIKYDKVLSFETAPALTAFPADMKQEVLAFISCIGRYFENEINKG